MRRVYATLLLAAALMSSAAAARAQPLIADLSEYLVAITTGFTGSDVLLFGAVEAPGDVVVVIEGPPRDIPMFRKSQVMGVWANTARLTFERAPTFIAIASSRPLAEVAPVVVRQRHELQLQYLVPDPPVAKASANVAQEWKNALIRNMQREALYPIEIQPVIFLGERLFKTRLHLPSNVPTGSYQARVFLLQDGEMVTAQTTPLVVSKVGTEALVFGLAHDRPIIYGLAAIAAALIVGWLGHVIFRRS